MSEPLLVTTRDELSRRLLACRVDADLHPTVALVPTMGALHDGHRALIQRARRTSDLVVVSVFVNPLQFGSADDLARYPRTLEADLAMAAAEGVDLVWAPTVDEMYPAGPPTVMVSAGPLGELHEGASRPGHFDGVLTVVAKLLHQVQPHVVVFGAKDAQQVALVRRMVADLDVPVHVAVVDTVRAGDGLALSSRNRRLTPAGRETASAIPRALAAARAAAPSGAAAVRAAAESALDAEPGLVLDYLALVDPETFAEVVPTWVGPTLVLVAATIEGTRLIDNTLIPDRPVVDR